MRILVVAYWFPYPPDNGARQRQFQLLKHLSREHELVLLSHYDEDQRPDGAAKAELRRYCAAVEAVPRRPYGGHSLASAAEVVRGRVPWITRRYSPQLTELARAWLARSPFDLLIVSHVENLPLLDGLETELPIILEQFEVGTIWSRPQERAGMGGLRAAASRALWARYVRPRLARLAAVTVSSADELRIASGLMRRTGRRPRLVMVPNGVEVADWRSAATEPVAGRLIYPGALSYEPNLDAVLYFMDRIMPLVRARRPDARLVVTGRPIEDDRLRPHRGQVLVLMGYVEDIAAEVARSAACVVPARLGSGTKTKVLEAMALGTPVVSTTKGIEGLAIEPGREALVADEPAAFADHVIRLLDDSTLRARLAKAGRALVERRYDYAAIMQSFSRLCEEVAAEQRRPA